jgi:hypothetical protein
MLHLKWRLGVREGIVVAGDERRQGVLRNGGDAAIDGRNEIWLVNGGGDGAAEMFRNFIAVEGEVADVEAGGGDEFQEFVFLDDAESGMTLKTTRSIFGAPPQ